MKILAEQVLKTQVLISRFSLYEKWLLLSPFGLVFLSTKRERFKIALELVYKTFSR